MPTQKAEPNGSRNEQRRPMDSYLDWHAGQKKVSLTHDHPSKHGSNKSARMGIGIQPSLVNSQR
jgi:hypothetical protein